MIPGTTAAQGLVAPQSPIVPIAAFATADFVNGIYNYNGNTLTAANVIDTPGAISGLGLHLTTGAAGIQILNDFKTKLFTFSWTVVLDLNINVFTEGEHRIFNIGSETAAPFGYSNEVFAWSTGDWEFEDDNNDYPGTPPGTGTSVSRFIQDITHSFNDGVHIFGVTRTDSFCSLSVDGNPAITDNSPTFNINVGVTDVRATLGAYRFLGELVPNGFYLRSLKIYDPPVTDAQLVILTTP